MIQFAEPTSAAQLDGVRELWQEYWAWLEFEPCFQDFENELATLPGRYARPDGRLFTAHCDGVLAGCVAFRKLSDGICEMKRLYVRPEFRGKRVGIALARRIIDEAAACGYQRMRLDTMPRMAVAIQIYESLGFRDIEPYTPERIEGARYLELDLTSTSD